MSYENPGHLGRLINIDIAKNLFGSYSLGFLLVGLIYVVLCIIIYMLRSKFNAYILKKVGPKFFN